MRHETGKPAHRMGSAGDQEKSCTASSFTDFLSSSPMSGASYTLIALRPSRAKNLHVHQRWSALVTRGALCTLIVLHPAAQRDCTHDEMCMPGATAQAAVTSGKAVRNASRVRI